MEDLQWSPTEATVCLYTNGDVVAQTLADCACWLVAPLTAAVTIVGVSVLNLKNCDVYTFLGIFH